MREIKFRAWDKDKRIMSKPFNLTEQHINFSIPPANYRFLDRAYIHNKKWQERLDIMQYTGLKDKNGVEIYEGDICYQYGGHNKMVIKYDNCNFYLDDMTADYRASLTTMESRNIEVIGNIYEGEK